MLTYSNIHYTYSLPIIGALALITRPFLDRAEIVKIALISSVGFIHTTLWANYVISNGVWTFSNDRIAGVVGLIPIEVYMFLIVQSLLTTLWGLITVRWSTPCFRFNMDEHSYRTIRWLPILFLGFLTAYGCKLAVPGKDTFYLGCIFWGASPMMMFLWYGGGNFFLKKIVPSSVAIIVPTIYYCWIDQIARKNGIWSINETNCVKLNVAENLPMEHALFFLVTNAIIILTVSAYDKALGMMETFKIEFPLRFDINRPFFRQMFSAFTTSEYTMPAIVIRDLELNVQAASVNSVYFIVYKYFFQSGKLLVFYNFI